MLLPKVGTEGKAGKKTKTELKKQRVKKQRDRQRQKAKGEASSMVVVLMSHQRLSGTEPIRSRETQESGKQSEWP